MAPDTFPQRIQKQLDGQSARIVCSWGELLDHAETVLAIQPTVRVKLTDWPEIDLGDTRREAKRAIGRQFPGVRFSLPYEEEYDDGLLDSPPAPHHHIARGDWSLGPVRIGGGGLF